MSVLFAVVAAVCAAGVPLTSYEALFSATFNKGRLVDYKLAIPGTGKVVQNKLMMYEFFTKQGDGAEYGSEYLAMFSRVSNVLDVDPKTLGYNTNNTRVEVFTQVRAFKTPPTKAPFNSQYDLEFVEYTTVVYDTTGKYKVNQRLASVSKLFNFGGSEISFFDVTTSEPKPITSGSQLQDEMFGSGVASPQTYVMSLYYISKGVTIAGSYGIYTGGQAVADAPGPRVGFITGSDDYLWYGPDLEVLDAGKVAVFDQAINGLSGILTTFVTVEKVLSNNTGFHKGDVIENSMFELQWGKSLTMWKTTN